MEDLYLPPRSRKTLQQLNQSEGIFEMLKKYFLLTCKIYKQTHKCYLIFVGRGRKRKKAQDDSEDGEETGSEAEGSDDDRPKKRGRPRILPRENIKSFTDVEVYNKSHFKEIFDFLHVFNTTITLSFIDTTIH